jgi:hypothetical protein
VYRPAPGVAENAGLTDNNRKLKAKTLQNSKPPARMRLFFIMTSFGNLLKRIFAHLVMYYGNSVHTEK